MEEDKEGEVAVLVCVELTDTGVGHVEDAFYGV